MFVVGANGWMNSPAGFDWVDGRAVDVDPVAAMFNRASLLQGLHMTMAAFCATGFAVAGIHAIGLLKYPNSQFHAKAFEIALVIGAMRQCFSHCKAIGSPSRRPCCSRQSLRPWNLYFHVDRRRSLSAAFPRKKLKPCVTEFTSRSF